jgi:hypothetical protein
MYESSPMTGMPCDTRHPFPAPSPGDWADSMEYGDPSRLNVNKPAPMEDRDTSPLWRALAAWLWNIDCLDRHIADVVADPILTAHAITVATLTDRKEGSNAAAALRSGGLEACRRVVDGMSVSERTEVQMSVNRILHGYTALRLDLGGHFHGGQA